MYMNQKGHQGQQSTEKGRSHWSLPPRLTPKSTVSRQNQENSHHLTVFKPEKVGAALGISSTREFKIVLFVAKVHALPAGDQPRKKSPG